MRSIDEQEPGEFLPGSCGSLTFWKKFMLLKILSKLTVVFAALAFSLMLPAYFIANLSAGSFYWSLSGASMQVKDNLALFPGNAVSFSEQEQSVFGLPTRLKIPSINVDAVVEYVGLAPDGAMDAPKKRADAAWFNLGPRPGENGSAVIAGHYGWKNKQASVFDDLHRLRKGDKLYIEDDKGAVIVFVVREIRNYDPKADASGVFVSSDGKPHLNLITCGGIWNKVLKSYSKRLVVFADKE
ncbi:TPA: hypothetical protein DEX28_03040 [Patescibacteria group bacterium]|nr:hypothetical protein [Patescibacteria group bacterium]